MTTPMNIIGFHTRHGSQVAISEVILRELLSCKNKFCPLITCIKTECVAEDWLIEIFKRWRSPLEITAQRQQTTQSSEKPREE